MPYTVRRVDGPRNAALLKLLHVQIFGEQENMMQDPALDKGAYWIVYDEGGRPVGFCSLLSNYPRTGYLERAGVVKEHRGHGLQKRLIRVRERYARRMGWWRLRSDTCDTPASTNNLIACGFRNIRPAWPWSYKRATYWQKIIGEKP